MASTKGLVLSQTDCEVAFAKLDEIRRNFVGKGEGQAETTSLVVHKKIEVSKRIRSESVG